MALVSLRHSSTALGRLRSSDDKRRLITISPDLNSVISAHYCFNQVTPLNLVLMRYSMGGATSECGHRGCGR